MGLFNKVTLIGNHIDGIDIFNENELIQAILENEEITFRSVDDKKKTAKLSISKINGVRIIDKQKTIEKDKSVVGRAIAGSLVAGPLGTIVGGMSGIGKKAKKKKYRVLAIVYDNDKVISILEDKWAVNFDKFAKKINKLTKNENTEVVL